MSDIPFYPVGTVAACVIDHHYDVVEVIDNSWPNPHEKKVVWYTVRSLTNGRESMVTHTYMDTFHPIRRLRPNVHLLEKGTRCRVVGFGGYEIVNPFLVMSENHDGSSPSYEIAYVLYLPEYDYYLWNYATVITEDLDPSYLGDSAITVCVDGLEFMRRGDFS